MCLHRACIILWDFACGSYVAKFDIVCRNVSELHWSPAGRNIILAGLASTQGSLEFFNVDDMATLRLQAHFMCNNVRWDQSGRYVCSWVDASRDMDHGYVMWSFTGEILYRCGNMRTLCNSWPMQDVLLPALSMNPRRLPYPLKLSL